LARQQLITLSEHSHNLERPANGPCIAEVRRLDFAYADRLVLKHIDLGIPADSTLGLIGPNGGGKTTLIRLLAGLLVPTRGEILIQGMAPVQARGQGALGYLPQRPELNTRIPVSAAQFLHLAARSPEAHAHVEPLAASLGLEDLLAKPLAELSGGQLQRLLIARAVVNRPALLILDEPTTGIDVASRHRFIELLQKLRQQMKLTVVLSTHDLQVVRALCDDIACLNLTCHLHHRKPGEEIPLDETTCSLLPGA
jgi:zinc transport system ATP-binding protein